MNAPTSTPNATGNLAKTPFAHLVLYLYQQRSTGTLLVSAADTAPGAALDPETAGRVLFRRGRAVAARLPQPSDSLEQALLPLCGLRESPFAFYEEQDLIGSGSEVLTGMFDPHAFVALGAHRYPRPDIVDAVLSRYSGTRLRTQLGIDVERLRLEPAEVRLIEVLRAEPTDFDTLCAQSELPLEAARRLLYVLIVTKLVVPQEERHPESFASQVRERDSQSAMPAVTPKPPARPNSDSVVARAPRPNSDSVVARNPLMPTTPSSSPSAHPPGSRPPAWQALASMRPPGAKDSTTAFKAVRPTSITPRASMAPVETLDTPGKLKRIEQLFQRSAYDEALPIIRALVAQEANNAHYHGLLGYALLVRTVEGVAKEVVEAVNAALRLNGDEPRALYTKALAYKRTGREREALHYFKRTVAVEPGHIEAAREIRLLTMRANDDKKSRR